MKINKTLYLIPFLLIMLIVLSACSKQSTTLDLADSEGEIKVASSIYPVYSIVNYIGGDRINNHLILPAGSSPHTYDASPQDIKALNNAQVIFSIGAGADNWLQEIINIFPQAENFSLENSVNLAFFSNGHEILDEHEGEEVEFEDHGHEAGDIDPHYWLSPENAKLMAEAIALKLSEVDPEGRDVYLANANNFKDRTNTLSVTWQEKISNLDDREIIVFHDAWNYFANYFNLEIAGSFEPFPGKSPGPQYLKSLQAVIREHNIKAIFVEPQLSASAVQVLASDLNIKVETLDPIGGVDEINSYFDLIEYNVDIVYKALKTN
ncbi:MAG: metal ABC transporter substrate-binding protein [Candidatus Pacebacteria bacterium]|nr:metal ABC transporter substrate-binding protein [Candidatus Paceibacterota bacterium]